MPKLRLNLRLSEGEYDFLCRYAHENGDLSLNAALKLILSHIRRGGAKKVPTSCVDNAIN
jgi:hypothetical protein